MVKVDLSPEETTKLASLPEARVEVRPA